MEPSNRPNWIYQGAEAGRSHSLTADQLSYAIALRRQLAERLAREAARVALGNFSALGKLHFAAAAACRREARRMERALGRSAP